jgi:hypothetical protein
VLRNALQISAAGRGVICNFYCPKFRGLPSIWRRIVASSANNSFWWVVLSAPIKPDWQVPRFWLSKFGVNLQEKPTRLNSIFQAALSSAFVITASHAERIFRNEPVGAVYTLAEEALGKLRNMAGHPSLQLVEAQPVRSDLSPRANSAGKMVRKLLIYLVSRRLSCLDLSGLWNTMLSEPTTSDHIRIQ